MKKITLVAMFVAVACSTLNAIEFESNKDKDAIEKSVKKSIGDTPLIINSMDLVSSTTLADPGWTQYIVKIKLTNKDTNESRTSTNMFFTNGSLVSNRIYSAAFDSKLEETLAPHPDKEDEIESRRILGNSKSKHSVFIFSDPRCPFCKEVVPSLVEMIKKRKESEISVFLVNTALPMHPVSRTLIRITALENLNNRHLESLSLYKLNIKQDATPPEILKASNKLLGTKYKMSDLYSAEVEKSLKKTEKLFSDKMITGTPSIFLDGKKVKSLKPIEDVLNASKNRK